MDIQSSAFNQLFALYPIIIQGGVRPVKPDGIADGGIPKVLYDGQPQGLELLIDPWTELQLASWIMAADDRVDLYKQGHPTPITGKTVAPGEEQLRIRLYLPHGWLDQGVNGLYYKVIRVSGNVEQSRDLRLLYHLRLPDTLDVEIPPDVIQDGVGPERAARGVPFGFTYNNRRNFDRIEFSVGDATFRFDVPDAPTPITHTLFTDAFQRAGDNPSAVVEFKVFDQLGNVVRSPEKRLDIHLGRLTLLAPTVRGMNGNQFSPVNSEVRVIVPQGPLLSSDKLWVKWKGATDVAAGSYTSPPRLVSAGLEIAVPRSVLAYSLGQQVTVTYVFERNGIATESPPLLLNILTLPETALTPPKIVEADANNYLDVLALGTNNATIHALLHTLIEAGQPCWLRLEGKKSDGSVHDLAIWSGLPYQVNATWINQGFWPEGLVNSYLKQLGHGTTLTIKYKVALDKSNVEANAVVFPDRVYTIKAVELAVPTLDNVLDSAGNEVLQAGVTVSSTLTLRGTANEGLQVEIFDGNGASAVSKGTATAHNATRIWEHPITVPLGARRLYAKSLYHNTAVYSNVRNLTVISELIVDTSPLLLNQLNYSIDLTAAGWLRTGNDPAGTSETRTVGGGVLPYSFTTSAPEIASVDSAGCIRSEGNGEAIITISDAMGQTKTIAVTCTNVRRILVSPNQMVPSSALAWIDTNGTRLLTTNTQMLQTLLTKYFSKLGSLHYTGTTIDNSAYPWTVIVADYALYPNGQYIKHTIGTNTHPWPAMTLQR
ncbi:hypothetical protein [Pseudomonas mandelii]|uniref:hypothetical protein n=1 Tax=Pseudomonas mandelii TaxID=75612 RepID=UPI00209EF5E4|nr:hypothetical protein [Pseudomonas mandelii]MCO8314122.1 hypothetical protein [Pseudomonas mandelii]